MLILEEIAHASIFVICLNEVLLNIGCGAAMVDCRWWMFLQPPWPICEEWRCYMALIFWLSAIDNSGNDTPLFCKRHRPPFDYTHLYKGRVHDLSISQERWVQFPLHRNSFLL
jgi:hypothetical protein